MNKVLPFVGLCALLSGAPCLNAQSTLPPTASPVTQASPATPAKPGLALPIRYKLQKASKVSLNIYDENGAIVRELLNVAQRPAGEHLVVWDGLDGSGQPVPPGKYSWKMLGTQGLRAEHLITVGNSYSINPDTKWDNLAPGSIVSPMYVYADNSGLYVGGSAEFDPGLIKQSHDGKRLWEKNIGPYNAPLGQARVGETLWILAGKVASLIPVDPVTGANAANLKPIKTEWTEDKTKSNGSYLAECGGLLAVAYVPFNAIRWIDPATGEVTATTQINSPKRMASGKDVLYVSDGEKVFTVGKQAAQAREFITGLKSVRCLAVDQTNGDILLFDGGQYGGGDSQVKRFSKEGKLLRTYGALGGRKDGLYTVEARESFRNVFSIASMPDGGFAVAEPWTPPRRCAVFDRNGKWQREWYGAQKWAPWIYIEPDNPSAIWLGSDWNGCMRILADYKTKTWKVHSTYRYDSTPLAGSNVTISGGMQGMAMRDGKLYFYRNGLLMLVDREAGTWKPVSMITGDIRHQLDIHMNLLPPAIQARAKDIKTRLYQKSRYALQAVRWTDTNGDGVMQQSEAAWLLFKGSYAGNSRGPAIGWWTDNNGDDEVQEDELKQDSVSLVPEYTVMDGKFNIWGMERGADSRQPAAWKILSLSPVAWNAHGTPTYEKVPQQVPLKGLPASAQKTMGHRYLTRNDATGEFFLASSAPAGWGNSKASSMIALAPDGSYKWAAGSVGRNPGQIRNFRGIFGVVKNCVAAPNTSYEWSQEYLPRTYVWDENGLFVGGLLENPLVVNEETPLWRYGLGAESIFGHVWEDPKSGEVLFAGHGLSDGRIFRITGWDNWERQSGALELKEPAGTGGNGLLASLRKVDGSTVGQWVINNPKFDPRQDLKSATSQQLAKNGSYTLLVCGQITPPADGTYTFSSQGDGQGRLLIDGRIVLDNGLKAEAGLTQNPVQMKAGQRYDIQWEYAPLAGKPGGFGLLWNAEGQTPQLVPQSALFAQSFAPLLPYGRGTGLSAVYTRVKPRADKPEIERIDPQINLNPDDYQYHSITWKGFLEVRDTGWYRVGAQDERVLQVDLDGHTEHPKYLYLEAGRKYPIQAKGKARFELFNARPAVRLMISRWTAPNTDVMDVVPQSQLYPQP